MQSLKRPAGWALSAALALAVCTGPLAASNVTVVVNGQVMAFDQPPVMQGNRVFVPMRAIFERLGSSVVYSNGNINAQGNGRSVHLTIGSHQAMINGQNMTLDVAPFEVAGRTEVPLRFVAQSLGANVNWNANTSTVYITTSGGNQSYTPSSSMSFSNVHPANGATINTTHPAIRATFGQSVNRDSLRVSIDGRDVTPLVYANSNGFNVTPNFELTPGTHQVTATGTTASGSSFSNSWSFTTNAGAAANTITNLSPSPGSRVSSSFTVSGHTRPGSSVHIVANAAANALGGLLQVGTGTFQTDVQADGNGNFSASIGVNAVSGGQVRVIITATAPDGASIERNVVYTS